MHRLALVITTSLLIISFLLLIPVYSITSTEGCDENPPEEYNSSSGTPYHCWKLQDGSNRKMKHGDRCHIERNDTIDDIDGDKLIIDPCMDEENRNFMECVLDYIPSLAANDTASDNGTCQCYRYWPSDDGNMISTRPAYNHSLMESSSESWFIYDEHLQECVIEKGKRCGGIANMVTPYLCGNSSACNFLDPEDPEYMVCDSDSDSDSEDANGHG